MAPVTLEHIRLSARRPESRDASAQEDFAVRLPDGTKPETIYPAKDFPPRPAAVLVPAFESAGEAHLLLTLRPRSLPEHGGQISFPGGAWQEGDSSLLETALRETREELEIDTNRVEVVGSLGPVYIGVTHYLVTPFVAVLPDPPHCRPDPAEVEVIIELPVRSLMDPRCVRRESWNLRGRDVIVPFYPWGPHKIWGATARMLAMLVRALHLASA